MPSKTIGCAGSPSLKSMTKLVSRTRIRSLLKMVVLCGDVVFMTVTSRNWPEAKPVGPVPNPTNVPA